MKKDKILRGAYESKDVTLNFTRMGAKTRAVNMIIAFWNANVQGWDKLARMHKERPLVTTIRAILGVTVPSIILYLTQKDDKRYQEVPQWQKDLFWIVLTPQTIYRIPKPFDLGILYGTAAERILQYIEQKDPEALKEFAKSAWRAGSPGMLPTAFTPVIESITNYSFFLDRPIVSESLKRLAPKLQYRPWTTEAAKKIGEKLSISPLKVEHFIRGYFAAAGNYSLETIDQICRALGIVHSPLDPTPTLADKPIARGFIVREPVGSASESVNKFYRLWDKAQESRSTIKELEGRGREREAKAYAQRHPEYKYYLKLQTASIKISLRRKERDAIYESNLSQEEKRKRILQLEREMTKIAQDALRGIRRS